MNVLKRQECIEGWLKMTLITQLKGWKISFLACEKQLESYQDRAAEIYNVREINSLSDIANWAK